MSFFARIKNKIWGSKDEAEPAKTAAPTAPTTASAGSAPAAAPASAPAASAPAAAPPAASAEPVDVAAILDKAVADKGQKLNWKTSIVDLLKALDIDSSLAARKELAQELGYKGALDGSAEMNIWLHKQVVRKLAENGGKVPADLLD